jgi:hypothetical protein
MAKYALVSPDDVIVEFREYATPPNAVTDSEIKNRLIPVALQDVVYDPITEVRVGPTYVVQPAQVLETYVKRVKNSTEIEGMRTDKVNEVHKQAELHLEINMMQQIRSLSRLVNLLYRHTDTSSWPQAQRDAVVRHQATLDEIDDVRAREETKVNEVNALPANPTTIYNYDATAGWG